MRHGKHRHGRSGFHASVISSNSASYWGAIYIADRDKDVIHEKIKVNDIFCVQRRQQSCFLTGDKLHKSLFFINNTAEFRVDVLYGGDWKEQEDYQTNYHHGC